MTMKNEVKSVNATEQAAVETSQPTLTLTEAINLIPNMFGDRLLAALSRKYDAKFGKLPAEQASHREAFPAFASNAAMLYILTSAKQEAEEKIASEQRIVNVANLTSMVNAYAQADTLTEFQVKSNEQVDLQITNLRDKVDSPQEQRTLLKAVRNSWLKSIDYGYVRTQDNKLRRACHIFNTTIEAIAK